MLMSLHQSGLCHMCATLCMNGHIDLTTGEAMSRHVSEVDLLERLYPFEVRLAAIFDRLGFPHSPVLLLGNVADPGFYNLPDIAPVTTLAAHYTAAGTPVTDTYTGIKLWDLLGHAGA